jgi:MoaE-MoaD fusion protein
MRVRVLFFGMLREMAGKSSDSVELADGASVRDLLAAYEPNMPGLKSMLASLALAVNQQYADAATVLQENDEIALLPPVSGGLDKSSASSPASHAEITHEPIRTQEVMNSIKCGEDGAVLAFEGIVRNQTRGRRTLYLDYEAYEPMALQEMETLAAKSLAQFQIRDVAIVHRLGRLEIGETSVLIVVASAHRAAGFDACRWLIDTLKKTVPIWKKEYFEDGAVWADGDPFPVEIPRANS